MGKDQGLQEGCSLDLHLWVRTDFSPSRPKGEDPGGSRRRGRMEGVAEPKNVFRRRTLTS